MASTFQTSDYITFADVPLAKASHLAYPGVSVEEGDYTGTWIQGEVCDSLGAITVTPSSTPLA